MGQQGQFCVGVESGRRRDPLRPRWPGGAVADHARSGLVSRVPVPISSNDSRGRSTSGGTISTSSRVGPNAYPGTDPARDYVDDLDRVPDGRMLVTPHSRCLSITLDGRLCATMIAAAAQAMATSCRPDTDVGLFPGDCVGPPFWIHPRRLCVARHLLGKAMSRGRPHVRTSPVSAAHLPAPHTSRLAKESGQLKPR
jgi:hypothetical protein